MDCPICRVALVISEKQGIEIDYCPKCRGIWLDRGELDKIIERSTPEGQNRFYGSNQPFNNHNNDYDDHRHSQGGYYKPHRQKNWLSDLFD
ncbi:MAG: zf-TFIIB domain-containing protein [Bacteroidota bacterium]|nr:zf-TFIIB domain-containing protein [Bacteroidota bacterium]